jgi:hypothetical protein
MISKSLPCGLFVILLLLHRDFPDLIPLALEGLASPQPKGDSRAFSRRSMPSIFEPRSLSMHNLFVAGTLRSKGFPVTLSDSWRRVPAAIEGRKAILFHGQSPGRLIIGGMDHWIHGNRVDSDGIGPRTHGPNPASPGISHSAERQATDLAVSRLITKLCFFSC